MTGNEKEAEIPSGPAIVDLPAGELFAAVPVFRRFLGRFGGLLLLFLGGFSAFTTAAALWEARGIPGASGREVWEMLFLRFTSPPGEFWLFCLPAPVLALLYSGWRRETRADPAVLGVGLFGFPALFLMPVFALCSLVFHVEAFALTLFVLGLIAFNFPLTFGLALFLAFRREAVLRIYADRWFYVILPFCYLGGMIVSIALSMVFFWATGILEALARP